MKAALLVKNSSRGGFFEIRKVNEPEPKDHEVKIKVDAFGLNYADVMAGYGLYKDAPPLPAILGYECAGTITSIGKDVSKELLGKRVLAFTRFGSYAEYVCTTAQGVVVLPEFISSVDSLPLGTQFSTAWYAACEMVNLQENDNVLVHAAGGGVGTALIQICKWKKCRVIGLARSDEKESFIRKNGADDFINYKKQDYAAELKRRQIKIDVSFNAVAGSTLKKDLSTFAAGGRLVVFGAAQRMDGKFGIFSTLKLLFQSGFYSPLFMMMKTHGIIGFNMLKVGDEKPEVLRRCMENSVLLAEKKIFNPKVTKTFDVAEINQAHQLLASGNTTGKIAVIWNQG